MAKTARKVKAKGGRGFAQAQIAAMPQVRSVFIDAAGKRWRWVVVTTGCATTAPSTTARRVIRINREMHKREGESLIDTLFHEELHRLFPYLGERTICAMTRLLLPTLSQALSGLALRAHQVAIGGGQRACVSVVRTAAGKFVVDLLASFGSRASFKDHPR